MKFARAAALAGSVLFAGLAAEDAQALTAGEALKNMNDDQWFGYVSGVVDGLATARWLVERPDPSGMQCIYDWYTKRPPRKVIAEVEQWFERHPSQQAGILLHVLIDEECSKQ